MAGVFISYSRKDKVFARDIRDELNEAKRDPWIDWHSVPYSTKFKDEIFAAIEAADNFLFIISPNSLDSWMCGEEVAHALASKKRIVTILHEPVDPEKLFEGIKEIQRISYPDLGLKQTCRKLIATIDIDAEWVRQHTRLAGRAKEWDGNGRDESFLLRGMELQDAVGWLAKAGVVKEPKPLPLQEEYIRASQEHEAGEVARLERVAEQETALRKQAEDLAEQRSWQARRFRVFSLVLGVALVLALVATGYAYYQRAVAHARQLVASAVTNENVDPELSVLFAALAVRATWPWGHVVLPDAEDELHRAIQASRIKLTLRGHNNRVASVAWSPDARRLATGSADQTAKVWDAASGQELLTLRGHDDVVTSVAWSPDGQRLATGSRDNTAKVWDAASGKELLTLRGHDDVVTSVAWSPDGQRLATGSWDKTARVWEGAIGQELLTLRGHLSSVESVAWSPDGQRLATGSGSNTDWGAGSKVSKVWDVATGKELLTLRGVERVAWSLDGKRLATESWDYQTAKVWDAASGKELLTLRGHNGPVLSVAWSPDGRRLATGSWDRTGRVWDAATGLELLTLRGDNGAVLSVGMEPGRQAAGDGER
jgi:WD40 repeat protein